MPKLLDFDFIRADCGILGENPEIFSVECLLVLVPAIEEPVWATEFDIFKPETPVFKALWEDKYDAID